MSRDLKDPAYAALAGIGKALSHPHRLELLHLLDQCPRDVQALADGTARPIANTSQHLQVLAAAHLVERHRDGSRVVYALAPGAVDLLDALDTLGRRRDPTLRLLRPDWLQAHPAVHEIDDAELRDAVAAERVHLVDVRPVDEHAHGHVDGAISLPLSELDARLSELPRDKEIIACCRGPWCTWADEAVERLVAAGFRARRYAGTARSAARTA
ncbi:MAG: metalloregulator ArsR/SmtB family transcription factor [Alphaproteobacteria bacterium]|nr:metalloregulator ArsR/SmtB family transcription factor [Alphaproteobacteria bacterium]